MIHSSIVKFKLIFKQKNWILIKHYIHILGFHQPDTYRNTDAHVRTNSFIYFMSSLLFSARELCTVHGSRRFFYDEHDPQLFWFVVLNLQMSMAIFFGDSSSTSQKKTKKIIGFSFIFHLWLLPIILVLSGVLLKGYPPWWVCPLQLKAYRFFIFFNLRESNVLIGRKRSITHPDAGPQESKGTNDNDNDNDDESNHIN